MHIIFFLYRIDINAVVSLIGVQVLLRAMSIERN